MFENVAYATQVIGLPPKEQRRRTYHVLEMLALNHRLRNYPEQISGGEQQRVAIARALVNRPLLLLADEPTGNLDPKTSEGVFELFGRLQAERGVTFVIATHNLELARRADRVVRLVDGRAVVESG